MKNKYKIIFVKIIFKLTSIVKKRKIPILSKVTPSLYKEHRYTRNDLLKELGYNFYNIDNLKKIENVSKFFFQCRMAQTMLYLQNKKCL